MLGSSSRKTMKTFISIFSLLLVTLSTSAQDIDAATAMRLLGSQQAEAGLTKEALSQSIISNAYHDQVSGLDLVYLQQSYKDLPVFNQVQTLAFKNGKLVSKAGVRINAMAKKASLAGDLPQITAEMALLKAIIAKNIRSEVSASPAMISSSKVDFGKMDIARENITASLMWLPVNDGAAVKLVWQVYLVPASSSDYWLLNIDAKTGELASELNLTVYCNFDAAPHSPEAHEQHRSSASSSNNFDGGGLSPQVVNNASYLVIPYPAESPQHPGGTPAIVNNPWTLAPGNATSLKWHSNGNNDYNITRGNNVYAAEDRDGSNSTQGLPATSTTAVDPLNFDFVPDFTQAPTQTVIPNQQFNITNLFYWNNIIHDLVYQYGFDEAAGNFQGNNQGRGGNGNDYVIADAQDGGGTNNANFATPSDGSSGRMQMYLWNGNPQRDGDVDNGVIVHEFAHGISNRLSGGPSQSGCVSNAEQMGEGWSDYYSLMATQDWATAQLNDGFDKPRGIGTYVMGQPITGVGIRTQRYSTNFAINNRSFTASLPSAVHTRGEIWAATLWDMTWNIINQVGVINPDLFNANGNGGNSIALKLVTQGLKLQPCNSGFLDARDAILQADQLLYNGAYRCAIVAAFARRGMGFDARQGSANSITDQVPGYSTTESKLFLTQNVTEQLEGLNVTYNNRVTAGACSALTNYLLTDTLPANVTYVSGGNYNSATRVVSFNVNLNASQTQNYSFTVQVNNNTYFPTVNLFSETVPSATLPGTWIPASTNSFNFSVSAAQAHSAPYSFFGPNASAASDFSLATALSVPLGVIPPILSFWHSYNTEDGWDGGMVEISTDAGNTWTDLGQYMTENGYNGSLGSGSNNPLAGRNAFTGNSNGFIKTSVSLASFANQNARFRFRMGSDDNTTEAGWYIDDILLQSQAKVNIRSSLFNASATRANVSDTFTVILQNAVCGNAAITTAPASASLCEGAGTTLQASATGTSLSYQWQVSADAGTTFTNISGAGSSSLVLTNLAVSMNGNQYRVVVTNACPSTATSAPATITVLAAPAVTQQPTAASACLNGTVRFNIAATGNNLTYQWQASTDGGNTFGNLSNNSMYSGVSSSTLAVAGITAALNNTRYRAIVSSSACTPATSQAATLTTSLLQQVRIAIDQNGLTPGRTSVITGTVSPAGNYTYQWFFNGVALAASSSPAVNVNVNMLGDYSLKASDANGCSVSSNLVTVIDSASTQLFIYPNPNQGIFNVSYYNGSGSSVKRNIVLYDAKGARVYGSEWSVAPGYAMLRVVLDNVQGGLYYLRLEDGSGKQIAAGTVLIK